MSHLDTLKRMATEYEKWIRPGDNPDYQRRLDALRYAIALIEGGGEPAGDRQASLWGAS
jgi:hypothetical protein